MPGPPSAIVGQPPLTADDTAIVHGWQVMLGMGHEDPSSGLTVAAKPPPPGQPHTSDATNIAVGCSVSLVLMALFTGTRLLIRGTNKTLVWGTDDWTILVGTVGFSHILNSLDLVPYQGAHGEKRILDRLHADVVWRRQARVAPVNFGWFYVAMSLIKISIVCFYMRLTAFASRGWMWTHRIFIGALVVGAIIQLTLAFTYCQPYNGNVRAVGRGNVKPKCLSIFSLGLGYSVWHILSDCLLFVVPIVMLWRVQMKFWQKFAVCIAGIIGLGNVGLTLGRVLDQAMVRARDGAFDLTYTATSTFVYSISELTLGVMTANLPVLSIIAVKTVKLLSSSSFSRERSADHVGGVGKRKSRFYKRKLQDESDTEFGGLHTGGQPTVRHDVEYVSMEEVEAQRTTSPGKFS
ncbi:MAG: hypothetical protein Q9169_001419 [Polycauliona sp. 2 TL-2023]